MRHHVLVRAHACSHMQSSLSILRCGLNMPRLGNWVTCLSGSGRMPRCRSVSSSCVDIMQRRLEMDVGATMDSVRKECIDDLAAAAAALEAAVTTVAAVAEQPARRQPTQKLVTVCFDAVFAVLGAFLWWAQGLVARRPCSCVMYMVLATASASSAITLWALSMCKFAPVAVLTTTQFGHTRHLAAPRTHAIAMTAVLPALQVGFNFTSNCVGLLAMSRYDRVLLGCCVVFAGFTSSCCQCQKSAL